jgi:hypothetical protein
MKSIYNKIFSVLFLVSLLNCQGQQNEKYIGLKYGNFDIDKATFTENIDTLFSKIPHVEIPEEINGRKMRVFRVKSTVQDKKLFKYFNLQEDKTEFYLDDKNNLVKIDGMLRTDKSGADNFMKQLRNKHGSNELSSKKNKFIDDIFIGKIDNKFMHITKTCVTEGTYKGECSIIYSIYKYPQKDSDVIRFMAPNSIEVENLLKK